MNKTSQQPGNANDFSIENEAEFRNFLGSHYAYKMENRAIVKIRRELVGSPVRFSVGYVLLAVLGYFVSLSICAQHNLGLFVFSYRVSAWLSHLPSVLCALFCGAFFTGIPFLFSRIFLSWFQQRYLLFRLRWLNLTLPPFAIILIVCVRGLEFSHHEKVVQYDLGSDLVSTSLWAPVWGGAALFTPYFLEALFYLLWLRRKRA